MEVEIPLQTKVCESFLSTRMKKGMAFSELMKIILILILLIAVYSIINGVLKNVLQ